MIYNDKEIQKLLDHEQNTESPSYNHLKQNPKDKEKMRALIRKAKNNKLENEDIELVLKNRDNISKMMKTQLWKDTTLKGGYRKDVRKKGKQEWARHVR